MRSSRTRKSRERRAASRTLTTREQREKEKIAIAEKARIAKEALKKRKEEESKIEAETEREIKEIEEKRLQAIATAPVFSEESRLVSPIRCKSCGTLIANKYRLYLDLISGNFNSIDAFNRMKKSNIEFTMKRLENESNDDKQSILFYLGDISAISNNMQLIENKYLQWLYFLYLMMRRTQLEQPYIKDVLELSGDDEEKMSEEQTITFDIIEKHQARIQLTTEDIFNLLGLSDRLDIYEDLNKIISTIHAFHLSLLGWKGYEIFRRMITSATFPSKISQRGTNAPIDVKLITDVLDRYNFRQIDIPDENTKGPSISDTFEIFDIEDVKYEEYRSLVEENGYTPRKAFESLGFDEELYAEFMNTVGKAMKPHTALAYLGMYGHFYDVFVRFKEGYTIGQTAFTTLGGNKMKYNMYLAMKSPTGVTKEKAMNMLGLMRICCRTSLENPNVLPAGVLYKGSIASKVPLGVLAPHETIEEYESGVRVNIETFNKRIKDRPGLIIDKIGLGRQRIMLSKEDAAERDQLAQQMKNSARDVRSLRIKPDDNVEAYLEDDLTDDSIDEDQGTENIESESEEEAPEIDEE
uniref:RNA polymerase N 8 kDa subunit n=1 Tax=Pithovirus LCPAC404 TaxID=2506597 RepID=A0A481ZE62_9VIRU|nr:MAG: RNA polymerase N 8 kDa subunit [Pithovirus LCPAC404]